MFISVYPWLKLRCALMLMTLVLPATTLAHRLDEYLQATLVILEPDRVRLQINLTPGVAVAEQVLALIDVNKDGLISTNEATAYCESLRRNLILRLDERNLELKSTASLFPELADLRGGLGIIQIEFSAAPGKLVAGAHRLTLENHHLPSVSVYLINAAQPVSNAVQITKQIRSENQSVGEMEFYYQSLPSTSKGISLVALLLTLLVATSVGVRGRAREPSRNT